MKSNTTRISSYAILPLEAASQETRKYPHLQATQTPGGSTSATQDFTIEIQWFPYHASTKGGTVKCREHVAESDVQTSCPLGAASQVIGKYPYLQATQTLGGSTSATQDFSIEIQWFPYHGSTKGCTVKCREHVAETDVQTSCPLGAVSQVIGKYPPPHTHTHTHTPTSDTNSGRQYKRYSRIYF